MENTSLYKGIGIALVIIVIIFAIKLRSNDNGWDKMIKVIEKDEYYGRVIEKFIDKQNHNTPIIILSKEKKISLYGHQWDMISIGDSLSKKRNTTIIEVFKKDKLLNINQKEYIETLKKKNK